MEHRQLRRCPPGHQEVFTRLLDAARGARRTGGGHVRPAPGTRVLSGVPPGLIDGLQDKLTR
ncbi:hypothetical protein QJS66_06695 [Kocuria rhizophila]|nr:hypothetical protein QJS66_06695 [Kocuria rhizophila]